MGTRGLAHPPPAADAALGLWTISSAFGYTLAVDFNRIFGFLGYFSYICSVASLRLSLLTFFSLTGA